MENEPEPTGQLSTRGRVKSDKRKTIWLDKPVAFTRELLFLRIILNMFWCNLFAIFRFFYSYTSNFILK